MGTWRSSDSRFLKKEDVGEKAFVLEIESLDWVELGDEREEKPVVFFHGANKGLTLNKTMQDELSALFGDPAGSTKEELSKHFRGKKVEIYVDPSVRFQGKRVGGLRLRGALPREAAAATHDPTPPLPPPPPDVEGDDGVPF